MTREQAFWRIHDGLPRQGPGSDDTTALLFRLADPRRAARVAIDMGCGPGRSSLLLAKQGLHVTALDTHPPFLEELRDQAAIHGVSSQLDMRDQSMAELSDFPDESFDLVWAEGTAYLIGWETALRDWRRLIAPRGRLVATDVFWTTNTPSSAVANFWADEPFVQLDQAVAVAEQLGYKHIGSYLQPDSDWFDEYYEPLEERIAALALEADSTLKEAIERTRREIELRREHPRDYGHVGVVLSLV